MITHPELLSTAAEISNLAQILRTRDAIAFDTEFIRETTFFPTIEILQVATRDESWLIDARAFKLQESKADSKAEKKARFQALRPLLDVFEDPKILKIIHAAQGDQECLYTSFGVVASPSLDTAVAASLCGYGDGVGLGNLLKAVMNVSIKKGHARTNWSVRPLPPQLVEYAHADVQYLVALGERLLAELDQLERRQWAMELSAKWEDRSLYEPDPEGLAHKLGKGGRLEKRGYAALLELVRWREERVRQLNLPRRWVADDNVLLDLAHVRPKDMEHLSAFRGLNKGELKNSGEAILAALRRASEMQNIQLPKMEKPEIPSAEESQVMDLMKCYLGILADGHRLAVKHLVPSTKMLALLRSNASDPQKLVDQGILSAGAARLVGGEVIALLQGKRGLSIRKNAVHVVNLDSASQQ